MFEQDYIMRQIKQFIQALEEVLFKKKRRGTTRSSRYYRIFS
ncbi:DUF6483 family protein [Fodinibius roseus]